MAETNSQFLIGSHGWMHSQWESTFYPDDLPEDWQLGYYANEFSIAVIEQNAWNCLQKNPDIITDWISETESGLRFVCELSLACSEQELNAHLSVISQLGNACLGVILLANESQPADSLVTAILNKLPVDMPCILDLTELPDVALLQQWQQQYPLSLCWRAMPDLVKPLFNNETDVNNNAIAVIRLQSGLFTLKQLRRVIESACNQAGADSNILLIVDGDPPDVELMRNVQLIYDML